MIDSSKIGPVEMLAVSFPRSQFKGEILPELADLAEKGLIRVIDLVVVAKDEDGTIHELEINDMDPEVLGALGRATGDIDREGLFGEEDLDLAAEMLEPGSAAALLIWEDIWAGPIAAAIRNAGGVVLAHERVPHEAIEELAAAISAGA